MQTRLKEISIFCFAAVLLVSCSPKNFSTRYYYQNEKVLDGIEKNFKTIYKSKPFSVGFTGRNFETVSITIKTDTLNYIYDFLVHENRLADTLKAYHMPVDQTLALIKQMQSIECTWISNYDYYVGEKKQSLVFMSVKQVAFKLPFAQTRYYILSYFNQPQYFDKDGKLLEGRRARQVRKINGDIFTRINDKVCYTVSIKFR